MGKAIELVTVMATAPGTAGVQGGALSGNSLVVRNGGKPALMVSAWRTGQAPGFVRITSPYAHDAIVGVDMVVPTGTAYLFPAGLMVLQPQDELVLTMGGSATAGDIEHVSMLLYYPDLPGADAHLITAEEYRRRVVDFVATRNTVSTSTTGQYTGSEAVNAEVDPFKAKTEYAMLGLTVQAGGHAVRWVGPDFANLGIGAPCNSLWSSTNTTMFLDMAVRTGLPLIPVMNSANKDLTLLSGVSDENGVDPVISTVWGRLK